MKDEGYSLTPLARSILHPVDPLDTPRLYRQALLEPPLYSDLAVQFAGKKLPEASILGNVLYHNHQIIASAKQAAAEAFLESARFAGALGEDNVFRPDGTSVGPSPGDVASNGHAGPVATIPASPTPLAPARPARSNDVRIDLRSARGRPRQGDPGPGPRGHHARELRPIPPGPPPPPDGSRSPSPSRSRNPRSSRREDDRSSLLDGADQTNSLIRFSSISCRPLALAATSPLGRM